MNKKEKAPEDALNRIEAIKKKVIYTCLTNSHDSLEEPTEHVRERNKDWDMICFTDNPDLKSKNWKIIQIPKDELKEEGRKTCRKYKILAHKYVPEYNISVWMDASCKLNTNLDKFVASNLDIKNGGVLALCKHRDRNCLIEEYRANICRNNKGAHKDIPEVMLDQIFQYFLEGYPVNNGMVETGILIRNHGDKSLKVFSEMWWNEVKQKSIRDQLSFNYVMWNYPISHHLINSPRYAGGKYDHSEGIVFGHQFKLKGFARRMKVRDKKS